MVAHAAHQQLHIKVDSAAQGVIRQFAGISPPHIVQACARACASAAHVQPGACAHSPASVGIQALQAGKHNIAELLSRAVSCMHAAASLVPTGADDGSASMLLLDHCNNTCMCCISCAYKGRGKEGRHIQHDNCPQCYCCLCHCCLCHCCCACAGRGEDGQHSQHDTCPAVLLLLVSSLLASLLLVSLLLVSLLLCLRRLRKRRPT